MRVDGWVFISELYGHRVRSISPTGMVAVLAGSGVEGYADGVGAYASFKNPAGLKLGPDGYLYLADLGNHCVRRINPTTGHVATIAGRPVVGAADGRLEA